MVRYIDRLREQREKWDSKREPASERVREI